MSRRVAERTAVDAHAERTLTSRRRVNGASRKSTMIATTRALWVGLVLLAGCAEPSSAPVAGTQAPGAGVARLRFVVQPGYAIAKGPINPTVEVAAQDEAGRTVTSFTGAVSVALGANPSRATLSGATTAVAVNGVASFPGLSIDSMGTGYALITTASGVPATMSTPFNVTLQLVFTVQPVGVAAGAPFDPAVEVSATDATGAVVSSFGDSVTVALWTSADLTMLSGTTTVAAVAGVATFSNLRIGLGGTGYTLIAVIPEAPLPLGVRPAISQSFDVGCTSNCWTTVAPLPAALTGVALGGVNGVLYAAGVDPATKTSTQAYDPATNVWAPRAPMPSLAYSTQGAVLNGELYVVGDELVGNVDGLAVQAYDPVTDTWKAGRTACATGDWLGIYGFGVATANGTLYAAGGSVQPSCSYDPVADRWAAGAMAPMPEAAYSPGVGVVNGILYVAGGADDGGGALGTVQAYDPASNTWTYKNPMPTARSALAVGVLNGVLYAIGGRDSQGSPVSAVEAYDPAAERWTVKTALPLARAGLSVAAVSGRLYAVGGQTASGATTSVVIAYQP